jgi:hypothetical protein
MGELWFETSQEAAEPKQQPLEVINLISKSLKFTIAEWEQQTVTPTTETNRNS